MGDIRDWQGLGDFKDYGAKMHPTVMGYHFLNIAPLERGDRELSNGAGFVKIRWILRKLWQNRMWPKKYY